MVGESEGDYVARQRALRDEAAARMRNKFGPGGLSGGGGGGGGSRNGSMAGLGSDSSYNPGKGYGGGEPGLGDIGSKGMQFLTSSLSSLSTGVQVRYSFGLVGQKTSAY